MTGYVYIIANRKLGTIYTGVTNDIARRIVEHRDKTGSRFARKHDVWKLVYIEPHDEITSAIAREKAIKKWRRAWKIELIESVNPDWRDLYFDINR
jgi:putative endonuclease